MSFWVLLQVIVNIVLIAAVVGLWIRLQRPAKDDPRLSRGLQLLQSKISVLEDLSDRTETQVSQLTNLLEHKAKEIQSQTIQAEKTIQQVQASMQKSLEVARIFQDKIPHQEIIERQQTLKYVKAARMAHQGHSVEEIAQEVNLDRGEIEFIAKVNRDQLQFSEADLPEWAKDEPAERVPSAAAETTAGVEPQPLAKPADSMELSLSELGNKFRQATQNATGAIANATDVKPAPVVELQKQQPEIIANTTDGRTVTVKKVVFPRVDVNNNLT